MDEVLDLLYTRRIIREFTDEPVSDKEIEGMLKASMAAPSMGDLRPWHFVVVSRRKTLDKLADIHKYAYMLKDAPLAIVVCGDQKASERHWVEDTSMATQNLLLAARALGLGAVWISLYPKKKYQRAVRELLDIPDRMGVLCAVAVGCPADKSKARSHYDEARVHREEW
jgi:nitroreductase